MKSLIFFLTLFPTVLFAQQNNLGIWYLKSQTYSNQKRTYVWQRDSTSTIKKNIKEFGIIHWTDSMLEMSISYTPIEQQVYSGYSVFSSVACASYFNHYFTQAGNKLLLYSDRTKKKLVAHYEWNLNGTLLELKEL